MRYIAVKHTGAGVQYDLAMIKSMHGKKPLIYLGCALSNSPQSFKDQIEYLRKRIEPHGTVLKFLGLKPPISEAFQWDINCVRRCDVMVADLTYPSIGLGLELGVALEQSKPLITLADDTVALQRQIAYGYLDPLHFTLRYKTKEEAAEFVIGKIAELFPD